MKSVILFLGVIGLATQTHAQTTNDCYIANDYAGYLNSDGFSCSQPTSGEGLRKVGTYNLGDQTSFNDKCCRDTRKIATPTEIREGGADGSLQACNDDSIQFSANDPIISLSCSIGRDDVGGFDDYFVRAFTEAGVRANYEMECCTQPACTDHGSISSGVLSYSKEDKSACLTVDVTDVPALKDAVLNSQLNGNCEL